MTTIDRDELRKLADAATPGPWEAITDRYDSEIGWYMGGHIPNVADEFRTEHDGDHPPLGAEDAKFIAAAREAVPALLDQLDAAEARIAAVDAELLYAELHGNDELWAHNIRNALDAL